MIESYKKEIDGLGIFKMKVKKEISRKIDECNARITNLKSKLAAEVAKFEDEKAELIKPYEYKKNPLDVKVGELKQIDEQLNANY